MIQAVARPDLSTNESQAGQADAAIEAKLPVSAFIICMNEEEYLGDCIESLDQCAEIIIVDSGSTDGTVETDASTASNTSKKNDASSDSGESILHRNGRNGANRLQERCQPTEKKRRKEIFYATKASDSR